MNHTAELKKPVRHFLPADFTVTDWEALEPYFQPWNNGSWILRKPWKNG